MIPRQFRSPLTPMGALFTLALFALPTGEATAIERLPEQIPALPVTAADALQQAIQAVKKVEQQDERLRAITRVFYDVRQLEPRLFQPLVNCLQDEWSGLKDQRLVLLSGEALYHLPPEFVLRQCRRIDDQKTRDRCLQYYVQASQDRTVAELRPLIAEVADPGLRRECTAALAYNRQASLTEIKTLWRERMSAARVGNTPQDIYSLAVTLERFAEVQFGDVTQFVRDELSPDDGVRTLSLMAGHFDYWRQSPRMASRLLEAAADVVPACANPADSAQAALHSGLAKHHPHKALKIFDKHLEPKLTRSAPDNVIAYLAPAGIEATLERSERISTRLKLPQTVLSARVMGRIASSAEPSTALLWIKATPRSPLRDLAVSEVAQGLWSQSASGRADTATVQQWLDALAIPLAEIADSNVRARACESLHTLARYSPNGSPATVPQSVCDEYARLWRKVDSAFEPDRRCHYVSRYTSLLPLDVQVDAIRAAFEDVKIRPAAALVHKSSLNRDDRLRWYQAMLVQAREIRDPPQRSATLSGIAKCLREVDPDLSLRVLWEGLKIAQDLKLQPEYHDLADELGTVFPYVSADESLRSTIHNAPREPAKCIQSLWSFAREEKRQEEREALLEAVCELLLRQKETAKAAAVAEMIGDHGRRARLWGGVAVVESGLPLREDW